MGMSQNKECFKHKVVHVPLPSLYSCINYTVLDLCPEVIERRGLEAVQQLEVLLRGWEDAVHPEPREGGHVKD